ncbi:uncharacterized protein RHIMIDRAFT_295708 [Rhizopus microsporus ATCC 52813]|uniref:Uncharacterized protein n=1 Tax=Rhizopus microsporus ATCC 52813 TaxID=1340429 RepID=A0A2G4SG44_RHIZD|nr:uncharacterized protein RHIMIDRAFT_295708 [Rhizopus microsporus ATCC 52813]PHZ07719.1 hypothetical protein RHIMIDRAFT_295708 [Rhizopus microsporus ATCC 52813]
MSETQVEEMVEEMDLDEDPTFRYGKLLLLDGDRIVPQEMEVDIVPEDIPLMPEVDDSNKALSYKAYCLENIKKLIHLMQEKGSSATNHAKACFIPHSTAYEILKQWNKSDGTVIPVGCVKRHSKNNGTPKTNNAKLTQQHT